MMYLGLIGIAVTVVVFPFILRKISSEIEVNRLSPIRYFTTVGACFATGLLLSAAYTIPFYFDFVVDNGQRVVQSYQWSLKYTDSIGGMLNSFFSPLWKFIHHHTHHPGSITIPGAHKSAHSDYRALGSINCNIPDLPRGRHTGTLPFLEVFSLGQYFSYSRANCFHFSIPIFIDISMAVSLHR